MFEQGYYEKLGYKNKKNYKDYRKKYKSACSASQIYFLLGILSDFKFFDGRNIENVLEVGVYNGVTSLYMLKEGCKNTENYKQYGIDIGDTEFFGEAVFKEATAEELEHFSLYRNSTALDIENVIPKDTQLDMVFIDAGHSHPHPLIDLLCVLPYLHDESIVMLHDVINYMRPNAWGESFIFEAWIYPKYRNINIFAKETKEETLGVIEIPKDKNELYEMLLTVAKLPFRAAPWKFDDIYLGINEKTIHKLHDFMLRHYDNEFTEEIIKYFYTNLENYRKEWLLRVHETRFYNYLFESVNKCTQKISILEDKMNLLDSDFKIKRANQNVKYTFLQKIFSIKNSYDKKHKIITILGIKIKFKRKHES